MSVIIDRAFARAFAAEWIGAWSLERIFPHPDDFEMRFR